MLHAIWNLVSFVFWFLIVCWFLTMAIGLVVNLFDAYYKIQAKK